MKDVDYYLGFTARMAPGADGLMTEPDAPANYKRADAIADYKRDALAKFMAQAHQHPFTATLTAFAVLDDDGPVFAYHSDEPGRASEQLVLFLSALPWQGSGFKGDGFERYPVSVGPAFTPARRLWGLDIDTGLRIAAVECLRRSPGVDVPLRLWYQNTGARDPYDLLTGAAERRIIGLEGVARYFDLPLPPADRPYDANLLADFARRLVARAQLTSFAEVPSGRPGPTA